MSYGKLFPIYFLHIKDAIDGSGFEDFDSDTEVIRVSVIFFQYVFASVVGVWFAGRNYRIMFVHIKAF